MACSGGALGSRLAPWSPPPFVWSLCVACVALRDMDRHFAWRTWHLWHWAGSGGPLVSRLAAAVCVAGVALGDIELHFAWQAWHFATWIVTLRGRRGTYGAGLAPVARLGLVWRHRLSLCVAGVALCDMDGHFAWQAWHLATSTVTLRGRRGTLRHGSSLCVAGVALMALGWLRWRAWVSFGAVVAAAVCVAGVALGDIDRHFAWQEWHFGTWIVTLRGRRGTYGTGLVHKQLVPTQLVHTQLTHTHNLSTHKLSTQFAFVMPLLDSFLLGQFIHIHTHTYPCTHDTCI